MTYSTALTTSPKPSSGTSRDFFIHWQGRIYGPFVDDEDARIKNGFRFDGGEPLTNPLTKVDGTYSI